MIPVAARPPDVGWVHEAYRAHAPRVLRRARSILGDDEAARDAVQEIFTRLLERPAAFNGHSAVTTFLYSVTTRHCLNALRDRKNRARLVDLHVDKGAFAAPAGEAVAAARQVLARVSPELGEVAVYFYFDEMTYDEIAVVAGCSRRHVADLLDRFRAAAALVVRQP